MGKCQTGKRRNGQAIRLCQSRQLHVVDAAVHCRDQMHAAGAKSYFQPFAEFLRECTGKCLLPYLHTIGLKRVEVLRLERMTRGADNIAFALTNAQAWIDRRWPLAPESKTADLIALQ
jgi:hypothetical protein